MRTTLAVAALICLVASEALALPQRSSKASTASSGLKRVVTKKAACAPSAAARNGDLVVISYEGRLQADGTVFDSSLESGKPIEFVLGEGRVIEGWDTGIKGTCKGESLELTIPPSLAYGEQGAGNGVIPPNASLVFTLTLEDIKRDGAKEEDAVASTTSTTARTTTTPAAASKSASAEVKSSPGLEIEVTVQGSCSSGHKLKKGDTAEVLYTAKSPEGKVYLSNTDDPDHPLKVKIGSTGVAAWDEGLLGACPGQTRKVTAAPDKAYGSAGVDGVIPPNATVVFEVKIAAIQNPDLVKSFLERITSGGLGR